MQGFCAYHHKDIAIALSYARKDAYRGFSLRYGLYEHDAERYVERSRAFPAWLARQRGGLHPLLAALSDGKVAHALLVWDVTKALRLLRAKTSDAIDRQQQRRRFVTTMQPFLEALDTESTAEAKLRASIHGAELTAQNERTLAEIEAFLARLVTLHGALWDAVAALGVLEPDVIESERGRQLPR